ncbi:hypothetical protein TNCV_2894601 [Trichonephila clavipes]|nr:hypothetical protein TNCV_2894601 [Trichonephila clavipes]
MKIIFVEKKNPSIQRIVLILIFATLSNNTVALGDGPRNFEQLSSDEYETELQILIPCKLEDLELRQMKWVLASLYDGSLALGFDPVTGQYRLLVHDHDHHNQPIRRKEQVPNILN